MNQENSRSVNVGGKPRRYPSAALPLLLGLALLLPGAAALASVIPGVDIIVQKKPPRGIPVTLPVDASGKFSLRLREAGNYTLSTACRQPSGCLPHKISGELKPGAGGEPSIIAILIGLLLPAQKASADDTTFNFTVGDRGVVLSGQFQDAAGVLIAVGDINGDGRRVAVAVNPVNDAPGIAGGTYLEIKFIDLLVTGIKIAENNSPLPTTRAFIDGEASPGIIVGAGAGAGPSVTKPDGKVFASGIIVGAGAGAGPHASPKGGDGKLPGTPNTPIVGIPIGLEGDPEGIKVSATTGPDGAFHFDKLPAGKYKLKLDGLSSQSLTVGADGIVGGVVLKGSDGTVGIFDRWGNSIAVSKTDNDSPGSKAAEKPVGFGSGNTMGAGPGSMGPGPMNPGAMGGAMTPGGGMMGPGRAMGGAGMGRP